MLPVTVFLFCTYSSAQKPWTGILNAPGASSKNVSQVGIDWSQSGIPGGIPSGSWTQCGSTIQAATYGNGSTDATSAINSALRACGANQYVLLGAGTFLINSSGSGSAIVTIPSNVVLRGSGPNQTTLNTTGTNTGGIILLGTLHDPGSNYGANNPVSNSVNISSGSTAGSTSIVVSDASHFTVGGAALIQETNDPAYVTDVGGSDTCTYCDGYWNGQRARGQVVHIDSVSGTTIGFDPPLYTAYNLSPQALPYLPTVHAGLEALQIFSNDTHTGDNQTVYFNSCMYCWMDGVEVNYTDGDYIKDYWGFRNQISDNYFTNGFQHGPGTTNNSITIGFKTTAGLIVNNIFERCENPVMLKYGAAGMVIAYNYATGCWGVPSTITTSYEWHAAHIQFALMEGNIGPQLWLDAGHGSTSQTTSFRNWYLGTSFVCSPTNDTRATVSCSSGAWSTDGARAISDDSESGYSNFVGDIVGSSAQESLRGTKTALLQWPSSRPYNGAVFGLTFGFTLFSDSSGNSMDSTVPYSTSFIHGVYNNIDGSTTWASGVTHTLPASFFLASKPSWWGSAQWPAIGPDVTGGAGPGGHANMIPAEACFYNVMGGTEGGAGGPLTFNPASCYSQGGTQPIVLQPPTDLAATVQ